jgi:hypothetical protein
MKKLILLLITLTTFTNVSYASFPVTETQQTDIVECDNTELPRNRESSPIWGVLSLTCAILSILLIPNFYAMFIAALLGVIFGAIGFNKKLKGLAITGFILGLPMTIISGVVVFIIWAFREA